MSGDHLTGNENLDTQNSYRSAFSDCEHNIRESFRRMEDAFDQAMDKAGEEFKAESAKGVDWRASFTATNNDLQQIQKLAESNMCDHYQEQKEALFPLTEDELINDMRVLSPDEYDDPDAIIYPTSKTCMFKGVKIDIYRMIDLLNIEHPAHQHAFKKLARAGSGDKSLDQDIQEVIDSLVRWQEMREEEKA